MYAYMGALLMIGLYITNSIILVLITKLGNQNQKFWSKFFLVKCITYVQITKWTPNVPLGFILPMSIFTYWILCHCGNYPNMALMSVLVQQYKFSALQFLETSFCSINASCFPLDGRFLCTNKISAKQCFETSSCYINARRIWTLEVVIFCVLLNLLINKGNCQNVYPHICYWQVRLWWYYSFNFGHL